MIPVAGLGHFIVFACVFFWWRYFRVLLLTTAVRVEVVYVLFLFIGSNLAVHMYIIGIAWLCVLSCLLLYFVQACSYFASSKVRIQCLAVPVYLQCLYLVFESVRRGFYQ